MKPIAISKISTSYQPLFSFKTHGYSGSFIVKTPGIGYNAVYTASQGLFVVEFNDSQFKTHTNPAPVYALTADTVQDVQEVDKSGENRINRLETQLNNLVTSTWSYIFDKEQQDEMNKLSREMIEDGKKIKQIFKKFQESDNGN